MWGGAPVAHASAVIFNSICFSFVIFDSVRLFLFYFVSTGLILSLYFATHVYFFYIVFTVRPACPPSPYRCVGYGSPGTYV